MRNAKIATLLSAVIAAGTVGTNAWAGTNTGSLPVTASVAQTCFVSATSALAFGAYDPVGANAAAALTATGSISLRCTKGSTGITADLSAGANFVATQRKMIGTANGDLLNYSITQPATVSPWTSCAGSTVWGSTVGGTVYTPTGVTWAAATPQAFTVCGSIPAGQNMSADSYTDTITVTVNF